MHNSSSVSPSDNPSSLHSAPAIMQQRRRSKLEEGRLAGASVWPVRRYVLLTAVAVISLALPAALTFRPSATRRGGGKRKANVDHDAWLGIAPGIAAKPASADDIHVVFSTDCSPYQNYQATMLFHSAEVISLSLMMIHSSSTTVSLHRCSAHLLYACVCNPVAVVTAL